MIALQTPKFILRGGRIYASGPQGIRSLRKQKEQVRLVIEELRRAKYLRKEK